MIRQIKPSDIPKLRELQGDFEWTFNFDFLEGLVAVDEHDQPIMFAGAWKLAEVHCAIDSKWSTPGARLLMLEELHEAMRLELRRQNVGQAVTWFDDVKERFMHRLKRMGWMKSSKISWHRGTNG